MTLKLSSKQKKALGKLLITWRLKLGLSQGEVAKKLKFTSPQFVSNVERGVCEPTIEMVKFYEKLDGTSDYLWDVYYHYQDALSESFGLGDD